jgi:hypothetical protein
VTLRKLRGPTLSLKALGFLDYVLLSHDHHFDNLDHAGRAVLADAKMVLTTDWPRRLGGNAVELKGCTVLMCDLRSGWRATSFSSPDEHVFFSSTSLFT